FSTISSPTHTCLSLSDLFHRPLPTAIYTLSLHDALPISKDAATRPKDALRLQPAGGPPRCSSAGPPRAGSAMRPGRAQRTTGSRSEEHTSQLQSRENLVCRHLLEKKK